MHLKQPHWLKVREIASIHEVGAENDITINPDFERASDLLRELGERLFGARADGPVESVPLGQAGDRAATFRPDPAAEGATP